MTRLERIALIGGICLFAVLAFAAAALHLRYGEVLFFKRVIAGTAGCL